ncbi:unnamed protein product [Agarophyton chilense]
MGASQACAFVPAHVSLGGFLCVRGIHAACDRSPAQALCARRTARCCAPSEAPSVPLFDDRRGTRGVFAVSHAKVLSQCVNALSEAVQQAANKGGGRVKLTVDFPPERSESRAGTLVSRYENNLNFTEKLLARLGVDTERCERVGGVVDICDNVNPQGGGEYLSDDECMVGFRAGECGMLQGRRLLVLFNAGMDGGTLRGVKTLDEDEDGVVVLVNCGLDRLSWFAKRGFADYIDGFKAAYYLKAVGGGWLFKSGAEPWRTFVRRGDALQTITASERKPRLVDVETQIRLALAALP